MFMKYLVRFNESLKTSHLQEQFEMELAYLLEDMNLCIKIGNMGDEYSFTIMYDSEDNIYQTRYFRWNRIKDQFIPFLQRFSKQYNILKFYMDDHELRFSSFDEEDAMPCNVFIKIDDLVNDSDEIPESISRVDFFFKLK